MARVLGVANGALVFQGLIRVWSFAIMRRTETLRLYVVDRSVLARNMYNLLFRDLPGFRVEYGDTLDGLTKRQRRARPHLILVNGNALSDGTVVLDACLVAEYPTIVLASPSRTDLKELAWREQNITLVEKPFYPYDLIAIINRVAGIHHPVRIPKRVRERQKAGRRREGA